MVKRLSFKEFKFNSDKPTETFHVKEKALKSLFYVNHAVLYTDFSDTANNVKNPFDFSLDHNFTYTPGGFTDKA